MGCVRSVALTVAVVMGASSALADANRLVHVDAFAEPWWPSQAAAKLTTPQWVGEQGVELVIVLGIDDMRDPEPYEAYLRPVIERLKQLQGDAPVGIFANHLDVDDERLQVLLEDGLTIENHTLTHPCPLLQGDDPAAAAEQVHGSTDLLAGIANNQPVAFRMPCFDSINSASPRFYAEIFNDVSPEGRFLTMSSSVALLFTDTDEEQPRGYATDADGQPRFGKYVEANSHFVNYIENYPYPYVIARLGWELPAAVPDDWQGQNLHGDGAARTVADMAAAIDAAAHKRGIYVATFHPYAWLANTQMVELIDHAIETHGEERVRFLSFREVDARLREHLLGGHGLRAADGGDNGVRVLDLSGNGYMDVVIANNEAQLTRLWNADAERWEQLPFPVKLVSRGSDVEREAAARFGVLQENGAASVLVRTEATQGLYHLDVEAGSWKRDPDGLEGLPDELRTADAAGRDQGVRLRDLTGDGVCELIVANEELQAVYRWTGEGWAALPWTLPDGVAIVTPEGTDAGCRFVDLDGDGYDDIVFSNGDRYSVHLFDSPRTGYTRPGRSGTRGDDDASQEIPPIVRSDGTNNGAWFARGRMFVQNERTGARLPNHIDQRTFEFLAEPAPDQP